MENMRLDISPVSYFRISISYNSGTVDEAEYFPCVQRLAYLTPSLLPSLWRPSCIALVRRTTRVYLCRLFAGSTEVRVGRGRRHCI